MNTNENGSHFKTARVADFVADLDGLESWVGGAGVRYAGTRVDTYHRHIRAFREAEQQGRELELQRELGPTALFNAMFEAADWQRIYQAFGARPADKGLRTALRKAICGPEFHDLETKTNARDTQFELSFGALLELAGLPVEFGCGGDLRFPLRDWQIFVECKRVQTAKKIPTRVNEAQGQLEVRYEEGPDPRLCRGLVAISVTKPTSPGPRHRLAYGSWPDMASALRNRVEGILKDHKAAWNAKDPRTIGVAVQLGELAWVEPGPYVCPGFEVAWRSVRPRYHPDDLLFDDIRSRVEDSLNVESTTTEREDPRGA